MGAQSQLTKNLQISELGLRVITAAVLIPVVLWLTVTGGLWFQLLILLLGLALAHELIKNLKLQSDTLLYAAASGIFLVCGVLAILGQVILAVLCGIAGAAICVFIAKLERSKSFILGGGIVCGSIALVALIALRSGPEFGLIAVIWLFCVVWSADTLAYFSGRSIGGPKLAPAISPNKTWAGFFGGMLGAAIAGGVLARVAEVGSELAIIVLSAVAAIIAQLGDLQESWAKRQLGVKDSGKLLPGHGGVWDRLDALIVVAVFGLVIGLVRGDGRTVAHNLVNW